MLNQATPLQNQPAPQADETASLAEIFAGKSLNAAAPAAMPAVKIVHFERDRQVNSEILPLSTFTV
jgi:hypothetical protein